MYQPTILIKYRDIHKLKEFVDRELTEDEITLSDYDVELLEFFKIIYNKEPVTICGVKVIVCTTKFGIFTSLVQRTLKKYGVEFVFSK